MPRATNLSEVTLCTRERDPNHLDEPLQQTRCPQVYQAVNGGMFRAWRKGCAPSNAAQQLSLSAPHPYQHHDPQSSSPPPTLLVSDTSCLQWHLFSALKIPFYTFQEPSSHPLSRWQTTDEGNRVLESLFLACSSAACWNSEAGWVLHRQGSVALQKPFNPSPQFSSMPSLSPNKFVLNLLTASAFQGHTLHNLLPTKLQKASKRAKERGLYRQPEPQFLLQSRCYFDKQMQKQKVDERSESCWSLPSAGDFLKRDRNRSLLLTFIKDHHPTMKYFQNLTLPDH